MRGDWKSADEIEADMKAGTTVGLPQFILNLWRRVDELQERVAELQRRRDQATDSN